MLSSTSVLTSLAGVASAQTPTADLQPPASCTARRAAVPATSRAGARPWPAPLDRVVRLRADDVALRDELARVAADAGVRFSYSPELIPLERAACVAAGEAALGDALVALLAGTGVAPVVAGPDQVVLAPTRDAAAADAPPEYARTTSRLARVVVTGTATGSPERASPFALSVVDVGGRAGPLARGGAQSLGQLLDGAVPGMWMWTQSPTNPLARYGSVRGASSFGVSAPKVYVDGIELANPLLLTQLDPSRVQRVEVIRGPQGAALYGADAIGGVVNVVTRQEGVGPATPAAELRASAGASASAFTSGAILAQDHGAVLRAGRAARSASLGVNVSTLGAFVPGAAAKQLIADASARRVGARTVVTGTAQFHASNALPSVSPLLAGLEASADSGARQALREYTLGTSVTLLASDRWTHALVAGIDGYRLSGVSTDGLPVPSPNDSALRGAHGGADRATLRLSSTARFGADSDARTGALTVGVEHSTARERTNAEAGALLVPREPPPGYAWARTGDDTSADRLPYYGDRDAAGAATWWSNTGLLAQGQLALANAFFLNGGTRLEYISVPEYQSRATLLPMLGAAWLRESGPLTLKLRAAYGRGIRPARTVARGATWAGGGVDGALTSLAPEEQSGVEAGADLFWGDAVSLHATRFDQRASGLVQPVARIDSGGPYGGPAPGGVGGDDFHHVAYQLQNVGAIDNTGWELQASSSSGPLTLGATLSLVNSTVRRVAASYSGDLRPGDRMLEVPARTLGLSATWASGRWSTSLAAARASDWINYDRLALARAVATARADSVPADDYPVGPRLRDFWRTYGGVTHVNARASLLMGRGTALTVAADNLLNRQVGEPDNVTVLPGRTVTVGVRAGF